MIADLGRAAVGGGPGGGHPAQHRRRHRRWASTEVTSVNHQGAPIHSIWVRRAVRLPGLDQTKDGPHDSAEDREHHDWTDEPDPGPRPAHGAAPRTRSPLQASRLETHER